MIRNVTSGKWWSDKGWGRKESGKLYTYKSEAEDIATKLVNIEHNVEIKNFYLHPLEI
jgi:hypothetical protein